VNKASALAVGDTPLVEGPGDSVSAHEQPSTKPSAALSATRLLASIDAQVGVTALLSTSERRAEEVARALTALVDPAVVEVLLLPPWDCLPFDRASPSRDVQGRRLAVLARLATECGGRRRIVVMSPEAMMQRAPPASAIAATFEIATGHPIDRSTLAEFARRTGYVEDDRIDEPGEIAFLGEVIDIFPAAAECPVRITVAEDRVGEIQTFDPLSQRTLEVLESVILTGASELQLDGEDEREIGAEHRLGELEGPLSTVLEMVAPDRLIAEPTAADRCFRFLQRVSEAHASRRTFGEAAETPPPAAASLYLSVQQAEEALSSAASLDLDSARPIASLVADRRPGASLKGLIEAHRAKGRRVVVTGIDEELKTITRMLRRLGLDGPPAVTGLAAVLAAQSGSFLSLVADFDRGFEDETLNLTVIAASDILGGRVAQGSTTARTIIGEPGLRIGDVVIHEDHGLGVLQGLERVEVAGHERDVIRLEYYGGSTVLAPVEEFGRLWRYGSEPSAVTLDRLNTDAWNRRRVEVSVQIDETARHLVELAKTRAEATCAPVVPPRAALAEFAARFPFPESPDQAAAIEAVISDLASGRPMDRLVCGDVGFGKTEVALRAAAAVALSGKQVLLAAPTTVLARQHLETFRRRFEGTGLEVGHLSRLVSSADAKTVKDRLKSGEISVVVGTHALASETLEFADLALTIVDEEHRFGAKMKEALQQRAPHRLVMTATPIPRTLQSALIGIQDVSVIATPPSRRRPIRTFLTAFDGGSVRTALLREKQRGGQSFVVVPRIEDMPVLAAELARLVPELKVVTAHGKMGAAEIDNAMVGFADGQGDVLLATNIIETGLDVPRANTMMISKPELFGLAQLHQLRGRVGRSRAQGFAYLLTDPSTEISDATSARLGTLEAFDRLGAGFAISARDLDLRGSGDLLGDEQAGHMRLIGSALYQTLLERAVRAARGEPAIDPFPAPRVDPAAGFPEAYIPDATIRINLYARLARVASAAEADAIEDEIADRFGPLPDEVVALLAETRVSALAAEAGVTKIVAGPKATALTFGAERLDAAAKKVPANENRKWVENRLVLETEEGTSHDNAFLASFLAELAA
jgi:transcription-repair coupling factor (superfamily II helicase)